VLEKDQIGKENIVESTDLIIFRIFENTLRILKAMSEDDQIRMWIRLTTQTLVRIRFT